MLHSFLESAISARFRFVGFDFPRSLNKPL